MTLFWAAVAVLVAISSLSFLGVTRADLSRGIDDAFQMAFSAGLIIVVMHLFRGPLWLRLFAVIGTLHNAIREPGADPLVALALFAGMFLYREAQSLEARQNLVVAEAWSENEEGRPPERTP
ncbi:MAG: hypothetical protein AAFQ75_17245 [Pseudomonadota bacterium]